MQVIDLDMLFPDLKPLDNNEAILDCDPDPNIEVILQPNTILITYREGAQELSDFILHLTGKRYGVYSYADAAEERETALRKIGGTLLTYNERDLEAFPDAIQVPR